MVVTRGTRSILPSRGNNEGSGIPVRGDVVDLTDDATTSAASNRIGSVDASATVFGFVGNFPDVVVGRNRRDLEVDDFIIENAIIDEVMNDWNDGILEDAVGDFCFNYPSESCGLLAFDIDEVAEVVEAAETIANFAAAASDALNSMRNEALLEDVDICTECGCNFGTAGLVWKIQYNNCSSCGVSICPDCYVTDPVVNGKMCGCCGQWHCDNCYYVHEIEIGYIDP
jgi:hypothetical protein